MGFVKSALTVLAASATVKSVAGYRVDIKDTDELREVCSGMYGSKDAFIEISFNPTSNGQLALVIYEWKDVAYLGAETNDEGVGGNSDLPKTYICTTSAVRSGLCSKADLGSFITTLPTSKTLSETSIFTSGVRFDPFQFPSDEVAQIGIGESEAGEEVPVLEEVEKEGAEVVKPGEELEGTEDQKESSNEKPSDGITYGGGEEEEEIVNNPPTTTTTSESATKTKGSSNKKPTEESAEEEAEEEMEEIINEEIEEALIDEEIDEVIEEEEEAEEIGDEKGVEKAEEEAEKLYEELEAEDKEAESLTKRNFDLTYIRQGLASGSSGVKRQETGAISDEIEEEEALEELEQEEEAEEGIEPPVHKPTTSTKKPTGGLSSVPGSAQVPVYTAPIVYAVPKSGYYCVGVVPVTLVNSKRQLTSRQLATHAEYSGAIMFRNSYEGELPAAEYPKIGFYGLLALLYVGIAGFWGYLCFQFRRELLPMQLYISGTIGFVVIEMIANWGYYRYINKHGGGASSLAFLFVVAILNAGRNSISFFLLLIVSMGLSVVTPSLGSVMGRVRILTILHFIFGVLYSIGTVKVELEAASLILVMFLILPLALTLTAFLMWTIISLNGTIIHLTARKQSAKLAMFKKLYRILMLAVIAIAGFFVISSLALSNRLEEDYAPKNWRYRWILLDASLATIYLAVFAAIAWLWRPSRENVRFAMAQELAQDEDEADAEDYELAQSRAGPAHPGEEEDDFVDEDAEFIKGEDGHGKRDVVFALEDDEDEDGEPKRQGGYRDFEDGVGKSKND